MIYSYKYLPHRLQGFHENIAFFFSELFRTQLTDVEKLVHPAFWRMLVQSERLLIPMQQLAVIYVSLTALEQKQVQNAFECNNAIEDLCSCSRQPYSYDQLAKAIRKPLKDFLTNLWEGYPFTKAIEQNFGTVKEHFDTFVHVSHQKALVCPFCGIHPLKPSGGKYRDAYDHFIPKALYPFSSVNFYNLVPTCTECNSDEKRAINVPYRQDGSSRSILYPFQTSQLLAPVEAHIELKQQYDTKNLSTSLQASTWDITLSRPGNPSENFTGWDEVYKVKRRYQERIRQFETDWWERFKDTYEDRINDGVPFEQIKEDWLKLYRRVTTRPMAVIELCYYRFLFSHPNLEKLLRQTLQ